MSEESIYTILGEKLAERGLAITAELEADRMSQKEANTLSGELVTQAIQLEQMRQLTRIADALEGMKPLTDGEMILKSFQETLCE